MEKDMRHRHADAIPRRRSGLWLSAAALLLCVSAQYSHACVDRADHEPPAYDADGDMLSCDGWTYAWNGDDRLASATRGTTRLEFRYDYMGQRFEKKVYQDSVLVKHSLFVYDGFKCVEELDALDGNAVTMRHAWQPFDVGLDIILTSTDADGTSYFLHDANKNVIQKATTDKTLLGKYSYEPFGTHLTLVNDDIGFSSEMAEKLQGIIYYNFRYYSLRIGRWISTDPLDDYSGYNLIRFVDNNPVDSFDLYSLETINVKSFIDSIPIDYSNLYREMINQNNSIENINNDHNDYCCVNGNIQEKVTDDAGRKCCLKQLRWIAIRHRAKNEWYDWGHTFMDLGYIGGRRYAYGFYMFSNLYSDEDVKKYSKSVYYRACPISITKLYKEMLDSDSIFTRRWFYFPINLYPIPGLFPYIKARNCTGAVSDWLKYAGFIPPSWLASQLPYFFKAGESK